VSESLRAWLLLLLDSVMNRGQTEAKDIGKDFVLGRDYVSD
jgi:hypothetical protein